MLLLSILLLKIAVRSPLSVLSHNLNGLLVRVLIYLKENNALLEQEQMLKSKMQSTIINMLAVSLIIMLLVMGIMFFISTKLRSVLSRYENHLLLSNKQIREQKMVFETLYQKSADGIYLERGCFC